MINRPDVVAASERLIQKDEHHTSIYELQRSAVFLGYIYSDKKIKNGMKGI